MATVRSVRSPSARGYAYVIAAATLFGANACVAKVVLDAGVPPVRLTALRCTGAALGLLLVLLATRPRLLRVTWREVPSLLVLGVVGAALIQALYFVAIDRLPVGVALLLEFTGPVLVALWCRVVLREPVRRRLWLAIGLALGGLALVAQVWRDVGLDPLGVAAGAGAAACLATYYLVGRSRVTQRDPVSLSFWMFAVGGLFWAVMAPWWGFDASVLARPASLQGAFAEVSWPAWVALAWVVVLGTLVPYALTMAALRRLPATTVGVVGMAEPVIAAVVAWAWLRQALTPAQVLGGVAVLAAVGLAQTASPRSGLRESGLRTSRPDAADVPDVPPHEPLGAAGVAGEQQVEQLEVLRGGARQLASIGQVGEAVQPGARPQVGHHVHQPRVPGEGEQAQVEGTVRLDVADEVAAAGRRRDRPGQRP